jgi:hypothetical protein
MIDVLEVIYVGLMSNSIVVNIDAVDIIAFH